MHHLFPKRILLVKTLQELQQLVSPWCDKEHGGTNNPLARLPFLMAAVASLEKNPADTNALANILKYTLDIARRMRISGDELVMLLEKRIEIDRQLQAARRRNV